MPNERILGMWKPVHTLWSKIEGNFYFAIIWAILSAIGGSAAVTSVWKQIQSYRGVYTTDSKSLFILCLLISIIILLAWIVAKIEVKRRIASPAVLPDSKPALSAVALSTVPRTVDLQGEILEIYFSDSFPTPFIGRKDVLMRVRIVNRGPNEATITHCGLQVSLGEFRATGAITDIPSVWRIRKQSDNAFLGLPLEDTQPAPRLGAHPHEEIYKQGHPREGWMNFELYLQSVDFPNAEFRIVLKDSLGGEHCIRRPSGVYPKMGVLVTTVPLIPLPEGKNL
jgi:hypothetical protein